MGGCFHTASKQKSHNQVLLPISLDNKQFIESIDDLTVRAYLAEKQIINNKPFPGKKSFSQQQLPLLTINEIEDPKRKNSYTTEKTRSKQNSISFGIGLNKFYDIEGNKVCVTKLACQEFEELKTIKNIKLFVNSLEFVEILSQGALVKVIKARHRVNGKYLALKFLWDTERAAAEVAIYQALAIQQSLQNKIGLGLIAWYQEFIKQENITKKLTVIMLNIIY